ncbi:DNA polymerase IV [Microbacterium sp. NC79]|uniref:DNA polymerase IV n=1 Tax=Microbacterium sp. NC79 TaxID=2851009 RepID=UPI001C2BACA7|nr:DNA polymerase IV [Microbacterium sp. NC79]MBV0894717.1 DNA polymerase IV [Microbacterium sp. NC79]
MGRGDGSNRVFSLPGDDDSGTSILHVDMDAFYASVAILDDPSLAGKAIIIGAPEGRSVVSSASYEARRFGVRAAMPMGQAIRLCPHGVIVTPSFHRYVEVSKQVMEIFQRFTPLVEPLSIDEAFLDVSGARRLWGSPGQIAALIRETVEREVGITCSVGVAATKHVAKMASTLCKPDGMLFVPEAQTLSFLGPRSVRQMWGVGPKAAEALENRGIRTIADVRATRTAALNRALGPAMGNRVRELAHGVDERIVVTEHAEKSIGHEETFERDVADKEQLRSELLRLADRVGIRLRKAGVESRTIAIKVRFNDFSTLSRSQTLPEPTDVGMRIADAARDLFETIDLVAPVRLIGVRAEKLQPKGGSALALWDDDKDWRRVDDALDDAAERFGSGAVTRAAFLGRGDRYAAPRAPKLDERG